MDIQLFERLNQMIDESYLINSIDMNELVSLPDELCTLLVWMVRKQEFSISELSTFLQLNEEYTSGIIKALITKNLIKEISSTPSKKYCLHIKSARKSKNRRVPKDIWETFD